MTDFWAADPVVPSAPSGGNFWDADPVAAPAPSIASDVAKSGGVGIAKGLMGLAGIGGDTGNMIDRGMDYVLNKLGAPAPNPQAFQQSAGPLANALTQKVMPTSAGIRSAVEGVTGPLPDAQTTPGKYAETIGEFAPAALAGPGGLIRRAITQAIVPGALSEAAGQATEGTGAEPYARIAGALAGGGVGALADRVSAARSAKNAVPDIQDVLTSSSADFKSPEVQNVTFKPGTIDGVANITANDLNRARLNERLAPQTHAILDDLKTPVNGTAHTIEDVQTARTLLGKVAGNFANPTDQAAASQAIGTLDRLMGSMPQARLATGDIAQANAKLVSARGDYASGMTAQRVADKLRNAELQAGSAYSGGNINNATRQKLRTLLTSKSQGRGLTPDELQSIENTVMGSPVGNALRAGGKFLGGGGGLHAFVSGVGGAAATGNPAMLALPAVGYGIKKVGDAVTRSNANKIVNQILSRSPTGIATAANMPLPDRLGLLKRMLLSGAVSLPLLSAQPQPQNANR